MDLRRSRPQTSRMARRRRKRIYTSSTCCTTTSADPWQHTNLAGRAETAAVSRELRERLLARIVEAGGKRPAIEPDWFPYS